MPCDGREKHAVVSAKERGEGAAEGDGEGETERRR